MRNHGIKTWVIILEVLIMLGIIGTGIWVSFLPEENAIKPNIISQPVVPAVMPVESIKSEYAYITEVEDATSEVRVNGWVYVKKIL
jgi:hypothetical protein